MPIKYFLVTDGHDIIAESPKRKSLSSILMEKIIPKLGKGNRIVTYENNYIYIQASKYYYFCIADPNTKQRICWSMIKDIETTPEHLDSKFLEQKIAYYNDNDKIQLLQTEMDKIKDVMIDNMDKILSNQETIDGLIESSETLEGDAIIFSRGANKLKWSMRKRLIFIIAVIVALMVTTLSIVAMILAIYFGR